MKNDPKELFLDRTSKFPGIFPDPVDADINFPAGWLPGFGKGEGDNIGIKIVLEELPVDFQQTVIGNKNILEFSQFLSFLLKQGGNGCFDPSTVPQTNSLFKMKPDSRGDCHNFTGPRYQNVPIQENEATIRIRTGNHCANSFV